MMKSILLASALLCATFTIAQQKNTVKTQGSAQKKVETKVSNTEPQDKKEVKKVIVDLPKIEAKLQGTEPLQKNQLFVGKDIYDDIYFTENNILKKKGKYSTTSYFSSKLGNLARVDLQNPMQLLLFYKDMKSFVLLSKELSELMVLDITTKFPSMEPTYIGSSTKKELWIANGANGTVTRYNLGTLERHTVYTMKEKEAKYYSSTINSFFFVDQNNLVKGIDIYGKEIVSYQMDSSFDKIQILDYDKMFYTLNDKMYFVDMLKAKKYEINLEEKSIESFFYNTQKLSIFADQKINNYLIKLP
ncbi:MAG: hypothetical protein LBE34_11190 [Flavobacteriaceae bacterium]|nr:hypothetical protein [Flavobacteriaceae bacterium]